MSLLDQEEEDDVGEEAWHLPMPEDFIDVSGNSTSGGVCEPINKEAHSSGNASITSPPDESPLWRVALNTHKAGMQGLDKERINKIILDATRGSRFYENEMKKEEQVQRRVERQRAQLSSLTDSDRLKARVDADAFMMQAEAERDLTRFVVHVDMDMFYAAVEMLDKPWLKSKPMAVGGMGMLSTSNYEARKYGVRAAMPGFIGKKLCPDLVLVPANFKRYQEESDKVRKVLAEYDPDFEGIGLDESFLDLTEFVAKRQSIGGDRKVAFVLPLPERDSGCKTFTLQTSDNFASESGGKPEGSCSSDSAEGQRALLHNEDGKVDCKELKGAHTDSCVRYEVFGNSVEEVVRELRFRVYQATGLTLSAGIAANRRLAKICSDRNKPNGQYMLPNDRNLIAAFMKDLPIRKVNGVGKVTERLLNVLGIEKCGQLIEQRDILWLLHSQSSVQFYLYAALGLGGTLVSSATDSYQRKSISVERTFNEISQPEELLAKCEDLCKALAEDVAAQQVKGKTVTLKLKHVTFEVRSRATTLPSAVCSAADFFSAVAPSLRAEIAAAAPKRLCLRLMGVRLSNLVANNGKQQLDLSQFVAKRTGLASSSDKSEVKRNVEESSLCGTGVLLSSSTSSKNEMKEEEEEATVVTRVQCPVCLRWQSFTDNDAFNVHIDTCLNRSAIQDVLHEEKSHPSGSSGPNTSQKSTSFQLNSSQKRKHCTSGGGTAAKSSRMKASQRSSMTPLTSFWS